MDDDMFEVSIEPPNLVVEVQLAPSGDLTATLTYDLKEVFDISTDSENIGIIDTHWHGIVLEAPDGETHHIDMRELNETSDDE
jgi:hypothetical protein